VNCRRSATDKFVISGIHINIYVAAEQQRPQALRLALPESLSAFDHPISAFAGIPSS
jgi:hypothetical protein